VFITFIHPLLLFFTVSIYYKLVKELELRVFEATASLFINPDFAMLHQRGWNQCYYKLEYRK